MPCTVRQKPRCFRSFVLPSIRPTVFISTHRRSLRYQVPYCLSSLFFCHSYVTPVIRMRDQRMRRRRRRRGVFWRRAAVPTCLLITRCTKSKDATVSLLKPIICHHHQKGIRGGLWGFFPPIFFLFFRERCKVPGFPLLLEREWAPCH